MRYASTRANHAAASAAEAIDLGMVPEGGLFVPEELPRLDLAALAGARYPAVAQAVLRPLLADFSDGELAACIAGAYNAETFDEPEVVALAPLGPRRHVLELWHGPTAAFKDVALQIMPHFMNVAKRHVGQNSHTVILVATPARTLTKPVSILISPSVPRRQRTYRSTRIAKNCWTDRTAQVTARKLHSVWPAPKSTRQRSAASSAKQPQTPRVKPSQSAIRSLMAHMVTTADRGSQLAVGHASVVSGQSSVISGQLRTRCWAQEADHRPRSRD
jgi:hypothetical protein